MKSILILLAVVLSLGVLLAAAQVHTFPASDTDPVSWTGAHSFTKQITSSLATGTAAFSIASTTLVTNLNAQLHNGLTAPGSAIVGITDVQTLTNKTLSGPILVSPFFSAASSTQANPALTGLIRVASGDSFNWRNTANGADIIGLSKTTGDVMSLPSLGANGTGAALTGTGSCATITTQTGGGWAGRATCTGGTAASTLTITPGTTAPNGWACHVQDQTTRANLFQQTSTNATACVLTVTSVTQNDVFVFSAVAF